MSDAVEVSLRGQNAHFHGVMRCGLVWACPVCAAAIKSERAEEVRKAVEWAGDGCALLLTLTVRHGLGDNLEHVRHGIALAMRKLASGAPWQRWKEEVGFKGSVRALEVTHGHTNGWHPHLHIVLLTERPMTVAEQCEARNWLSRRWRKVVERALGAANVPDNQHGCDLRPCHKADYLAKLGLEVTAPKGKQAKGGNRSPLEIAADFARTGDCADLQLWTTYVHALHGARQLTWSAGLRKACGLDEEKTDQEIVDGDPSKEASAGFIAKEDWDAVRDVGGGPLSILRAAESHGAVGVVERVRELLDVVARLRTSRR